VNSSLRFAQDDKGAGFSFGNPFRFLASNLLAELQHPWPSAFERKGAEGRVAAVIVPVEKLPAAFPEGGKTTLWQVPLPFWR
jgi:hypothetical protein